MKSDGVCGCLIKVLFIVNKRNKFRDFGYYLLIEGVRLIQVAL